MENREGYKYTFLTRDVQWSILASIFFFITLPFIWIVYLYQFNKYRKLKTIKLKGYKKESVKKRDRRFKEGYKIVGHVEKSFYKDFIATEGDLVLNKRKAYYFLIMTFVNLSFAIYLIFG